MMFVEFIWQHYSARGWLTREDVLLSWGQPCWKWRVARLKEQGK